MVFRVGFGGPYADINADLRRTLDTKVDSPADVRWALCGPYAGLKLAAFTSADLRRTLGGP